MDFGVFADINNAVYQCNFMRLVEHIFSESELHAGHNKSVEKKVSERKQVILISVNSFETSCFSLQMHTILKTVSSRRIYMDL
jgi:hypothetical protein